MGGHGRLRRFCSDCNPPDPFLRARAGFPYPSGASRIPPLYHQAEQAYRQHQFRRTIDLLDQLAAASEMDTQAKAYYQRQRDLCLQACGQKPAAVAAVPAAIAPAATTQADCGPRALSLVCQKLGDSTSVAQLRQLSGTTAKGTSMAGLAKAAQKVGLKTEGVQVSREALGQVELPALAWINQSHYVALLSVQGEGEQATATIHDPNQPK